MIWPQLIALLVLTIGNTELFVTLVNRIHALALPERLLQHVRHVHDVAIPLFPLWLIAVIGLTSPATLIQPRPLGDIWALLHPVVRAWFLLCMAGCIGALWSLLRYQFYRPAPQQTSYASRRIDVSRELGAAPVGDGPFRGMVGLPFNECFHLEVNERTLELARLPSALDGLSVLHLTDFHMVGTINRDYFTYLIDQVADQHYDLVLFTGDLLDSDACASWLPETLGRLRGSLGQYFILGNHDWYIDTQTIRQIMTDIGWRDLAGTQQLLRIAGAQMALGGTERPWMGKQPPFESLPDGVFRILLSHTPDNLSWARRHGVDLMLSGHNHGGQVVLPVIGPVYSPSVSGCRYAGGLFWRNPTLMYVSRGVSGRHPLRIRACPEVTHLILKCAR